MGTPPSLHTSGHCRDARRGCRAFTLIELMIVVAVVAILAAIAYPSYQGQVRKSNRAAAQSHLMDIANRQQQYFIDKRSYAGAVATLGLTTPADVTARYNIGIALIAGPPPGFRVTATAIGGQIPDGDLTIDNAGTKTPAAKW